VTASTVPGSSRPSSGGQPVVDDRPAADSRWRRLRRPVAARGRHGDGYELWIIRTTSSRSNPRLSASRVSSQTFETSTP
jgi:hypothetical protein